MSLANAQQVDAACTDSVVHTFKLLNLNTDKLAIVYTM